jgi:arylsulfatase A-like enzyme
VPADVTTGRVLAWLQESPREPFFLWVHYFDCHEPYRPPEPWRDRFTLPYDGEIAFMDDQVGRLLAVLREKGYLQRSLVVVTADHGEALGDHGQEGHRTSLYEAVVRVPLLVRFPDGWGRGMRVKEQARTVDIAPTVLARLGIESATDSAGVDLVEHLAAPAPVEPLAAYSETPHFADRREWKRSVRYDGWKLIETIESGSRELYDLRADPGETRNLLRAVPERVAELSRRLPEPGAEHRVRLPAEVSERLRALGYSEER